MIAVKQLHSTDPKDFEREARMLRQLAKKDHPHIVKLLATYRLNKRYHLMFPWASKNLRTYWQNDPYPRWNSEAVLWDLRQMQGIASGLHTIHNFSTDAPGNLYGRHGDIKPENILWFNEIDGVGKEGILQLTDFGLGRFHGRHSRSNINPRTVASTPTYEPPEMALSKPVSRAYDIWSLGCVFLEFITWRLVGSKMLEAFRVARIAIGEDGIYHDKFYAIHEGASGKANASVLDTVLLWIKLLHRHERCSGAMNDLLRLIRDDLLVTNAKDRISSAMLLSRLRKLVKKAENDEAYLLGPVPVVFMGKATLLGLLHQLFSVKRSLIPHATYHINSKSLPMVNKMKTFGKILRTASQDLEAGNPIFIIDAMDKCEEFKGDQLIKWFVDHSLEESKSNPPNRPFTKVLMLSQPYENSEKYFGQLPNVRLKVEETKRISADIAQVSRARLRDVKSVTQYSNQTRDKIEQILSDTANGIFLWVSIAIDLLATSGKALEESFERMKTTLSIRLGEVYQTILERNSEQQKLKEVLTAARSSHILAELSMALSILEAGKLREDIEPKPLNNVEQIVRTLCGLFVGITDKMGYVLHQAMREFPIKSPYNVELGRVSWKLNLDPIKSIFPLSRNSIWYPWFTEFEPYPLVLSIKEFKDTTDQIACYTKEHGFPDYAATRWADYFQETQLQEELAVSKSISELCGTQLRRFLTWFQLSWTNRHSILLRLHGLSRPAVRSFLGHEVVRRLSENSAGARSLHLENEIKICQNLIFLLVDNQTITPSLNSACEWYQQYLKDRVANYWPLIRSALKGVERSSESPSKKDFAVVISFVHDVARHLATEKDVTLCDIVDELVNAKLFKPELYEDHNQDQIIPNQLVFTVIGWLRMLSHLHIFRERLIMRSPPFRSTIGTTSRETADQGHSPEFGILHWLLELDKFWRT